MLACLFNELIFIGWDPKAPFEVARLYLEAGGKASKCIMSHLDSKLNFSLRTLVLIKNWKTYFSSIYYNCSVAFQNDETLLEFAKLGVYCQHDMFGMECSLFQLNLESDMPSDAQRMQKIVRLVKEGYEDRILMSHDVHTKHRLVSFCSINIGALDDLTLHFLNFFLSLERLDMVAMDLLIF